MQSSFLPLFSGQSFVIFCMQILGFYCKIGHDLFLKTIVVLYGFDDGLSYSEALFFFSTSSLSTVYLKHYVSEVGCTSILRSNLSGGHLRTCCSQYAGILAWNSLKLNGLDSVDPVIQTVKLLAV